VDLALQPAVAAFTGHMTDAPGRTRPRLPEAKVGALRARIGSLVEQHRVGFGFSSAARGSDLVFAEEVLARGGRMTLILPFPPDVFRTTSVETAGDPRWVDRFEELLVRAREGDPRVALVVLADSAPPEPERPRAYAACNHALLDAAVEQARRLGTTPRLLAVWDGEPGDGVGGAGDAIRGWRDRGLTEVAVVDPATL
jgi:hypothetical protein